MNTSDQTHQQHVLRNERSAGVVLFRDEESAPGGRLFLLLDYGRHWDYPKGHIEKDEDDLTAALRELEEETGIREVQLIDGFAEDVVYFFRHGKKGLVRKSVRFFLASTKEQRVRISHEHEGYDWLSAEAAQKRLTYPTAKQVFAAATRFLEDKPSRPGTR